MGYEDDAPPSDTLAEQCVLGAMMMTREAIAEVTPVLRGIDFYRPAHEVIYDVIVSLYDRAEAVDAIRVADELAKLGQLHKIGGGVYLHDLLAAVPVAANAGHYAAIVAETADLRGMIQLGTRIQQAAYARSERDTIEAHITEALKRAPRRRGTTALTWREMDQDVIDLIERGAVTGIPTPWPKLNDKLIGLVKQRTYVIGARTGEGKSLAAQAISTHAAIQRGKRVLFVSLEMSRTDLGVRIYADQANVNLTDILAGRCSSVQWEAIAETSRRLEAMNLLVEDNPYQSMANIKTTARGISDLDLIIIDYAQLVQPADPRAERRIQVDQISRDCKLLAKEADVPVVVLAQLSRPAEARAPRLSDFRESGAIEQDCDVAVLFDLDKETGELTLDVAKNRFGPQGYIEMFLVGHKARLEQKDLT